LKVESSGGAWASVESAIDRTRTRAAGRERPDVVVKSKKMMMTAQDCEVNVAADDDPMVMMMTMWMWWKEADREERRRSERKKHLTERRTIYLIAKAQKTKINKKKVDQKSLNDRNAHKIDECSIKSKSTRTYSGKMSLIMNEDEIALSVSLLRSVSILVDLIGKFDR
jgi:hypothetical protein